MNPTLLICLALGMRHAVDPDHLTAIDGLCRIRPRRTNGAFFALGHGVVVTILAAGIGTVIAGRAAFLGPWLLFTIGFVTLWKVLQTSKSSTPATRPLIAQPFLLGMILAAGFETASQLSALVLADKTNPWLLGLAFTGGMALVDGTDGYLAASTQNLAANGARNAQQASRWLGLLVVIFSFSLGLAELTGMDLDRLSLPLGLSLFVIVVGFRAWARRGPILPVLNLRTVANSTSELLKKEVSRA